MQWKTKRKTQKKKNVKNYHNKKIKNLIISALLTKPVPSDEKKTIITINKFHEDRSKIDAVKN